MLIKTIEEFKSVIGTIQANMSFDTLSPFVEQAELKYLIQFLGQEQYDELKEAYDSEDLGEPLEALLKVVQRPLAYFAQLDCIPFLNVAFGDAGVHQNTGSPNNMPAPQWTIVQLMTSTAVQADLFMEQMLAFLEKNIGTYTTYAESDAYAKNLELYINSGTKLGEYLNTGGSRCTYLALRPFLAQVEMDYIIPAISQDLHDEIKSQILDDELSDENKVIHKMICKAVAQIALYEGLPELSVQITGAGIRTLNTNDLILQKFNASADDRSALSARAQRLGNKYLNELRIYLNDNAADYPLYKESDSYIEEEAPAGYRLPDNDGSTSFRV